MTKTIYKRYRYNECDDFAAFLEDMASEGWEFEKWGAGLVFRKTEPQKIHYVVDVFPKAWNQDTRPAPNTLEFAEYCRAAGWKLIDGKSKFCIFKQIREDAQPIVTAQERFVNVAKAEGRNAIINFICFSGLEAASIPYITTDFPDSMFSNYNLALLCFWSAMFLYALVRLVSFFIWKRNASKIFRNGGTIWYGNHRRVHSINWWILSIGTIAMWVMVLFSSGRKDLIPGVVLVAGIGVFVLWIVAVGRPSRQTYTGIVILFMSGIFVLGTVAGILSGLQTDTETAVSDYPLLPSDYTSVKTMNFDDSDLTQTKSIFGSETQANIWYDQEEEEKSLNYQFYSTSNQWLLTICYTKLKEEKIEFPAAPTVFEVKEDSKRWHAKDAVHLTNSGRYLIRYKNSVLYIHAAKPLTDKQIVKIRRKLGLAE